MISKRMNVPMMPIQMQAVRSRKTQRRLSLSSNISRRPAPKGEKNNVGPGKPQPNSPPRPSIISTSRHLARYNLTVPGLDLGDFPRRTNVRHFDRLVVEPRTCIDSGLLRILPLEFQCLVGRARPQHSPRSVVSDAFNLDVLVGPVPHLIEVATLGRETVPAGLCVYLWDVGVRPKRIGMRMWRVVAGGSAGRSVARSLCTSCGHGCCCLMIRCR